MFEAVLTVCIGLAEAPCRDVLLPGFEAADKAGCEAALGARDDAKCVPLGQVLEVEEVAPGVFAHLGRIEEPDGQNLGDVANTGFIIGERSVAVIDCGSAAWIGEAMWRAIRQRTDLPVSHVILTHMHPDHVFGCAPFAELGATFIGHAALPRALTDRQENYSDSLSRLIGPQAFIGSKVFPVTRTVEDRDELDLGNRVLHLRAWPNAHTGNDLTVRDDASGVMFTGDLVFDRHTPALDGKLRGWQSVLSEMQQIPLSGIVPGHGGPFLDWPDSAAPLVRYLDVLAADTERAIAEGQRLGDAVQTIAESEAPHWDLFEAYNPRNATVAFTELEWE